MAVSVHQQCVNLGAVGEVGNSALIRFDELRFIPEAKNLRDHRHRFIRKLRVTLIGQQVCDRLL